MTRPIALLVLSALAVLRAGTGRADDSGVATIEPADLIKNERMIGRSVAVDDRVRLYQFHPGRGYDELILKRTPVIFRIPPELRPDPPSNKPAVLVHGILSREGDRWYCDVTTLQPLADDLTRLNEGIAALTLADYKGRLAWARWAERRADDFHDQALLDRARQIEGDAIRIEAEHPSADAAKIAFSLAERARSRQVAEPEPSALAHRGLRAELAKAKSPEAVAAVIKRIESFFPSAAAARGHEAELTKWLAAYERDPASAYRTVPARLRPFLDADLWADATQKRLELRAADHPEEAITLSEQASALLPDRPKLAARLLKEGLQTATASLGTLRQTEVVALAKDYREKLHDPDRALGLLRDWLRDQRLHHLRRSDAEGRVVLAKQYEELLGDEQTAVELLREALEIDSESREAIDVLRRKGFRKVNGNWVDPRNVKAGEEKPASAAEPARSATTNELSLKGCTPEEVRSRMGARPSRVVRSATQGRVVEQWIYFGDRRNSYINFRYGPGQSVPTVISFYSIPTTSLPPSAR